MAQLMAVSDRPLVEPLAQDIHLLDDIVMLHVAFKSRPLRDRGAAVTGEADVYTREKRNVVVSIWQREVASKVDTFNMKPGRERREDLNHPDWDEPILDLEEEPREGRVPVDTPVRTPGSSSWSAISN